MLRPFGSGTSWCTAALGAISLLVIAVLGGILLPEEAWATVTTFGDLNVNELVGADRFYDAGYTGTQAIQANIEAGHIWNGHKTLGQVTTLVTGTGALGTFDAHATRVGSALGGRRSDTTYPNDTRAWGIAYGAQTWSGAIATAFGADASFTLTHSSVASTYATILQTGVGGQTANVFNSSWGSTDPNGDIEMTRGIDGLINDNGTVGVFAAGNAGPSPNTVWDPAAGFNSIAVGALAYSMTDPYTGIASFSSRGPSDFDMATSPTTTVVIPNVRATVDIVAPGHLLTLANLNAQMSVNLYITGQSGTSFAAPIVAGGASLIVDAGKQLYAGNSHAIDGRVVKSVLLNSADKLAGWSNGQTNLGGVIHTTQSLDWVLGAGAMNLDRAFDQYVATPATGKAGTTDLAGLGSGDVAAVGWDYGQVNALSSNTYFIDKQLAAGTALTTTLSWFADRNPGSLANFTGASEEHLANLDLTIFRFDDLVHRNILSTVAESVSLYNVVEHLSFLTPESGFYGIKVNYTGDSWNFTGETSEDFGLAWSGTALQILAGDRHWLNELGGNFATDINWDPNQKPTAGDTAIFDLSDTYSVAFLANQSNDRLRILNGQVTFDLAGRTYSLTQTAPSNASVTVDSAASDDSHLVLTGGTLSDVDAVVGKTVGSDAEVVVGSGASWMNSGDLTVALAGAGALHIENGGLVSSNTAAIAANVGSLGEATVVGTGSAWMTSELAVGGDNSNAGGEGALTIDNGGSVSATNELRIWSGGTVTIGTGANSASLAADDVTIDGGDLVRGSGGTFALANGGAMTVQNAGHATFAGGYTTADYANYFVTGANSKLETSGGSLTIDAGAEIDVESGGQMASAANLNVADGVLSANGPATLVTAASGDSLWGYDGGTADITFSNNATGNFSGSVKMAQGSNSHAYLQLESNADLLVDELTLGEPGTDTAIDSSATLNVDGVGSSVTVGSFQVGDNSANSFAINVGTVVSGATFTTGTATSTIHHSGIVSIGSAVNTGSLHSDGDLLVDGGELFVGPSSNVEFSAGKALTLTNAGSLLGGGTVSGDLDNTSGIVAPGPAASVLTIGGDYLQGAAGKLAIDINGTSPGMDFDQLIVGGTATLDGNLDVTMESYVATLGDSFEIIAAAGGITGTFNDMMLPALAGNLGWHIDYGATSVALAAVLSGDFNADGIVDALDYSAWRNNLGALSESSIHFSGDGFNGVDEADFMVWKMNFGNVFEMMMGGGGLARYGTQVPEPSALLLAICAAFGLTNRRRNFRATAAL